MTGAGSEPGGTCTLPQHHYSSIATHGQTNTTTKTVRPLDIEVLHDKWNIDAAWYIQYHKDFRDAF